MDVRTKAGDIYMLNDELTVYGSDGIALRLSSHNVEAALQTKKTLDCIKGADVKGRRYTVAYSGTTQGYRFDLADGGSVRVREDVIMKAVG